MREYEVRRLIRLVEESEIGELEVWKWWGRIRIRKHVPQNGVAEHVVTASAAPMAAPPPAPAAEAAPAAPAPAAAEPAEDAGLTPVKSPMVGTFYRAPAPDADPYVQVGDMVERGQTICIIEAMKLMNEIQAETAGKVVRLLVENAQAVEFGQDLFLIKEN